MGWNYNETSLEKIKAYDDFKTQYCISNNIPLIRIPYYDYDKLSEEYVLQKIKEVMDEDN